MWKFFPEYKASQSQKSYLTNLSFLDPLNKLPFNEMRNSKNASKPYVYLLI